MATRAKNGSGSVQTVRRKGVVIGYRAVLRIDKTPKYGPLVQDPSEARSALLRKLQAETGEVVSGEPFSTSVRTLLDGRLKKEWSEATLELGETVYSQLHGLGGMPANGVEEGDVLRWRLSLRVSPATAHRYQRIVETWLKLLGNPVKAPKPKVREPDVRILTRDEQRRLLEACETERMRMAVLMMLEWGLRPGELCGLKHEDRHEDSVIVRRSASKRGGVRQTKTDRANRRLPILDPELDKWIGSGKGYLLSTVTKQPLNPSNLRRMLNSVSETAKLGKVTPMCIRHTAAVGMLSAGNDPATVADITGHSVGVLLNVYHRSTLHGKTEALRKARAWRIVDTA